MKKENTSLLAIPIQLGQVTERSSSQYVFCDQRPLSFSSNELRTTHVKSLSRNDLFTPY